MYKYKKLSINILTAIYIILFIVELIKYFMTDSNLYGVFYLLINLFIIFLLVPVVYNYKKYYSSARISKLIIILILGIFSNYILKYVVLNTMNYVDASNEYIASIKIIKNVLKSIIYGLLLIFTLLEFKLDKVLLTYKSSSKKKKKCNKKREMLTK